MTHRDPLRVAPVVALASTARRSTTTRRLDDSGRDSETRAREMAQQAAGAPVTVREAIQVRDEGVERDARVRGERFVARDRISIGLIRMGRLNGCVDETRAIRWDGD